ncbi:hypothetical protein [Sporomusa sp. GT1]|jgi:hypothetical protein|uniref:hypothetical protein n=1 Tax=Sporomusa sp. GT1 TaxID=1534747 RepID=UPI00166C955E|nr:hypothetical protein [Sporomusa sp. GT1]
MLKSSVCLQSCVMLRGKAVNIVTNGDNIHRFFRQYLLKISKNGEYYHRNLLMAGLRSAKRWFLGVGMEVAYYSN